MKEEYKRQNFIPQLLLLELIVIILSSVMAFTQPNCESLFYLLLAQNLLLLFLLVIACYFYGKIAIELKEDSVILVRKWKKTEIEFREIEAIEVAGINKIKLQANEKWIIISHRFQNFSAAFCRDFFLKLKEHKPDLITENINQKCLTFYRASLCSDFNNLIMARYSVLITAMSVLSFFIAMFLVVDVHSIRKFGEIVYLLYALAWPFITWLFFYLRFFDLIKKSDMENSEPAVSKEYFKVFPFALVLSAFAEIFILLSVMMYYR